MVSALTQVSVFLASPSDVASEREIIADEVDKWNKRFGSLRGIHFDLKRWETHTVPSIGAEAQDVINKQIDDNYDLFIGIFWTRMGTPTIKAVSGTVEEYQRAYRRYKDGENIQIAFYFKNAPAPMKLIVPDQISELQNFQVQLQSDGAYYKMFNDEDILSVEVNRLLDQMAVHFATTDDKSESSSSAVKKNDANALKVTEDNDVGILDLEEEIEELATELAKPLGEIAAAVIAFTHKLQAKTESMKMVNASGIVDRAEFKVLVNDTAKDMNDVSKVFEDAKPEFKSRLIDMIDKIRLAMNIASEFNHDDNQLSDTLISLEGLKQNILEANSNLYSFSAVVAGLPKLTSVMNQAKRRLAENLEDTGQVFQNAVELLEKVIGDDNSDIV